MKKIVKIFLLILLTVCTISLTSCGEYDTAQEKYIIAVEHYCEHGTQQDITITGAGCRVYKGAYFFNLSYKYTENYWGIIQYDSTVVYIDANGYIYCQECYFYPEDDALIVYNEGIVVEIRDFIGYEPNQMCIFTKEIEIFFNDLTK